MANPTLTYGHGYLTDCNDTTGFGEHKVGSIASTSLTVLYNDWFKLTGTCTDANDESVYYSKTLAPTLDTDTYTKYLVRWKTSVDSNGLGAKVTAGFTAGPSQLLVGEDSTTPSFNTAWQVTGGTLQSGKQLQTLYLYADDYPDSVDDGPYYVYYDFILFYTDIFTFPIYPRMEFTIPPRNADIGIFGRVGDITQGGGSESASIMLSGDMELGDGWGNPKGDKFYRIAHHTHDEAWQWFTSNRGNFKVTVRPITFIDEEGEGAKPRYRLELKEYRGSCASNESYVERFGLE